VKLYFISTEKIGKMEQHMKEQKLTAIPGTMQLHQLWTTCPGIVSYRILSCFCRRPEQCQCYDMTQKSIFTGPVSSTNVNSHDSADSQSPADIGQPCITDMCAEETVTNQPAVIIEASDKVDRATDNHLQTIVLLSGDGFQLVPTDMSTEPSSTGGHQSSSIQTFGVYEPPVSSAERLVSEPLATDGAGSASVVSFGEAPALASQDQFPASDQSIDEALMTGGVTAHDMFALKTFYSRKANKVCEKSADVFSSAETGPASNSSLLSSTSHCAQTKISGVMHLKTVAESLNTFGMMQKCVTFRLYLSSLL